MPLESQAWLARDQIMLGQVSSLRGFREGVICFPPTYKYKIGTSTLNTKRCPAWCDRVVYKVSSNAHADLLEYVSFPDLKLTSDHHPVAALMQVCAQAHPSERMVATAAP
ncbi:Inpp5e [Symbiodinium natans]|uniref:Inpp5e protein n=1 Tax=Symbiodinium natans TaxID=878477 RepID=A0A812PYW1_9DINO|nr:Inpp5e [Symbiodinium natans]